MKRLRLQAREMRQKELEKQNVKLSGKQEKEMNAEKAKKLSQQGKVVLLKVSADCDYHQSCCTILPSNVPCVH